ncbi:alpha-ribazole phosphatase [Desulfovibrionales bacterium]
MNIYLIRHGEIIQTFPRCFVGQTNLPLTARGAAQMDAVGAYLADKDIGHVWCSPLERCARGAERIAQPLGLAPEPISDLREISLGAWEGLTVDQVRERFPGQYEARGQDLAHFCPAGGESFAQVQERAWTAFMHCVHEASGNMAIVAHGGVNRTVLCRILGVPIHALLRLEQDYGCVNHLRLANQEWRVALMNFLPG